MWQNKLSGDIPPKIGKLNKLQDLNLAENSFFGNIPLSWKFNCIDRVVFI